jgi:hypothetical protein
LLEQHSTWTMAGVNITLVPRLPDVSDSSDRIR